MHIDDRLSAASRDLRNELDQVELPDFRPNRSGVPAVLALLVILGIGLTAVLANLGPNTVEVGVATQPAEPETEAPAPEPDDASTNDDSTNGDSTDDVDTAEDGTTDASTNDDSTDEVDTAEASNTIDATVTGPPMVGQLTNAEAGDFWSPQAGVGSWNADESRMVIYRTGSSSPRQVIVNTANGGIVAELALDTSDIEQVYWHPSDPDQLLFMSQATLWSYSVADAETSELETFADCDTIGSGVLPVPPSSSGALSLLCESGDSFTQIVYDLATGAQLRAPTQSDTAAVPNPTATSFVRWNDDGTASVLDQDLNETGVVLDVQGNLFELFDANDGRTWAATTRFADPSVGTLVLLPLDGVGDPIVVIGPATGDPFPPSGTRVAMSGSVAVVSTNGSPDGGLAGLVLAVDVADPTNPEPRWSVQHASDGRHDYWSTVFISPSPSGTYVAYSSDRGTDRVNTFIAVPSG